MSECALMMSVASESVRSTIPNPTYNDWDSGYGDTYCRDMLVRPHCSLGDAIFWDCRVLHFGLGNYTLNKNDSDSDTISTLDPNTIRSMLYINSHYGWFHDTKNWGTEKLFK